MTTNRMTRYLMPFFAWGAVLTLTLAGGSTPAAAQTVAFVGAAIETGGDAGRLENGTLLIQDDKIVAVGTDVEIPADARVVSLAGKTLMPGVIDPYYVFQTGSSGGATRTVTFQGRTFTVPSNTPSRPATFREVGKYFFPYDFNARPAVRSGITTANLVTDGLGLSAMAAMDWEPSPAMLFESNGRLFAKVTNQTDSLDTVRKPLDDAKAEAAKSKLSKPAAKPGEAKSTESKEGEQAKAAEPKSEAAEKSEEDTPKKYWQEVANGSRRLFVNLNNSASVAYLLQVAKEHEQAKIVLVATGGNLYPSLDEIAKLKNVALVLQPAIDTVPFTRDLMNVPRMLQEKEIPFAFSLSLSSSQLNSGQDDPLFAVASLVATGLDRQKAIQGLALHPATMLGIEKTHGSLAPNKMANFLIFAGDPLATGSRLEKIYVNGKLIHEN